MVAHAYKATGSRISPGTGRASPKTLEESVHRAACCSCSQRHCHSQFPAYMLLPLLRWSRSRGGGGTGNIWGHEGKWEGETCSSCLYRSRRDFRSDLEGMAAAERSWQSQRKPQGPASAVQEAECGVQDQSVPKAFLPHLPSAAPTSDMLRLPTSSSPPPTFRSL